MHGRISRRGSGFCHRNCKRDSSAGLNASTEKERREAAGGQPPWGDNTAHARGTALGTESGAVGCQHCLLDGSTSPAAHHLTAVLDAGHGGMLAESPPHRGSASAPQGWQGGP